jgi:outer membrane protein, multidrug efflux system
MNSMEKFKTLLYFGTCLILITSCKVNPSLQKNHLDYIPATFNELTDSSTIGSLPIHSFFSDPYLVSLIDTALKNNLDLLIASERIEILKSNFNITRGRLLPSLEGKVAAGFEKYGDYTMNGVGNFDTNLSPNISSDQHIPSPVQDYYIGFQSRWEVDLWGKLRNQKKAAYARYLASQKGRRLITTSLVSEVANLYYELLALDSKMDILQQNIKLQEEGLDIVEVQKSAGKVTQLAVEQFSAQLLNTKSEEAFIKQQIVESENKLNFLLARYPQTILRGEPIHLQKFPEEIKAGVPSSLLLYRPDIQQAELELSAADADIDAARKAFLPTISITPHLGINAFKAGLMVNPGSLAYGIFSGLTVPLLNRRVLKANHRIARARHQQLIYTYRKAVIGGYGEVVSGLNGIENYGNAYQLKSEQAEVLRKAVSTSNDLFLAGYASYLEVITAQKNVLEAEIGLINARKLQFSMLVHLYRSLGGGWK